LRVDFNTDGGGVDAASYRIQQTLPTILALRQAGARILLATHIGRPGGVRDERLSTRPLAGQLEALLRVPVRTTTDCVGAPAAAASAALAPGDVLMLENLR